MFTLFNVMRGTQGQAQLDTLARQFALSREQTQQTIAALTPAFALGIQRSMMDPAAVMRLWGTLASGQFTPFADPARAATPQGVSEGQQVLGALFGSQELNRQVVQQVASVTGVTTEIIRQMLPVVAAMMIGMLARAAEGTGMGQATEASRSPEAATPPNAADVWADMVKGMFGSAALTGGAASPAAPPPHPSPAAGGSSAGAGGPLAAVPSFDDIMRFFIPAPLAPAVLQEEASNLAPEEEPPAPRTAAPARAAPKRAGSGAKLSGAPKATGGSASRSRAGSRRKTDETQTMAESPAEIWGQLMQTSSDVGQQHLSNLQDLFAAYWGTDGRNR